MSKPVRIAVIGAGKLGSRHAEVYSKLSNVTLVGVCDTHGDRSQEIARLYNTRAFSDYRELLDSVDAASIVVPSDKHFTVSKDFLEKNVHLLIEKPIATRVAEADQILSMARDRKLTVQVGHIERFNAAFRTIKNIIKSPRLIQGHRMGPYDPRVADVGVTLDLMIHDIDIVLDLVKSPVKEIDAVGTSIFSKHEDVANARIRFENGTVCDLTASRATPDRMRKVRIFQDDAAITLDYVNQEAFIYKKENGTIDEKKIPIVKSDSLREELSDFITCVSTGRRPLVTAEEGRAALAMALEITRQIQKQL